MKLGVKKIYILYWILAILVFGGLFMTALGGDSKGKIPYQIVFFGDSVPGLVRDESGIPYQVAEALGKTMMNSAFGGTCVGRVNTINELDYGKESLSLVALTKAIANSDFGPQQSLRIRDPVSMEFESMVDELEKVDFTQVELVIIEHGVNDFYGGVPVRNDKNVMDEYTFGEALRTSIEALRQVNPNMRILLVTPTFSWLFQSGKACDEYNVGYGTLEAYIQEELKIAEEYGVEIIDIYHDFYPHETWDDWMVYSMDGLHPNEAGRTKIANRISGYLKGEN